MSINHSNRNSKREKYQNIKINIQGKIYKNFTHYINLKLNPF